MENGSLENSKIITISKNSSYPVSLIGGKGLGLQQLAKKNKNIPYTFVLTTEFTNSSDLSIISDVIEKLLITYGPLVFRSSANYEDSTNYSFAGLFGSYFENTNLSECLESIKRSYLQLKSDEVVQYALKNNINPSKIELAIIIQPKLKITEGGVLFTTNPVGNDHLSMSLVVTKGSTIDLMDGNEEGLEYTFKKTRPILPKELIKNKKHYKTLIDTSNELELYFGRPCDIEWGIVEDELLFFQMRPISTLGVLEGNDILWTRELSEERYPQAISPLGWTVLQDVFKSNLDNLYQRFGLIAKSPDLVAKVINYHVYTNKNFFSVPKNININPLKLIKYWVHFVKGAINFLLLLPIVIIKSLNLKNRFSIKWFFLVNLFKTFFSPHCNVIIKLWDKNLPILVKEFDDSHIDDLSDLSDEELYDYRLLLDGISKRYMEHDLAIYMIKTAYEWIIKKIGIELSNEKENEDEDEFLVNVCFGLQSNRTLEMNSQLERLANCLFKNDQLKKSIINCDLESFYNHLSNKELEEYNLFIKLNGHLTSNWDVLQPTWAESQEYILILLSSVKSESNINEKIDKNNKESLDFIKNIKKMFGTTFWMSSFFNESIETLREYMRVDEEHHFYCSKVFRSIRELFLEIGKRLVNKGVLLDKEDIFYLTDLEVKDALLVDSTFTRDFTVKFRKKAFSNSKLSTPPYTYLGDFIKEIDKNINIIDGDIIGKPASKGVYEGKVRIIKDISDAKELCKGEVLVVQSPNPVFTPLYMSAGALVTSTGSTLSHGLVSAREYGIPAVTGIPNIFSIFKNGETILVNGNNGRISKK